MLSMSCFFRFVIFWKWKNLTIFKPEELKKCIAWYLKSYKESLVKLKTISISLIAWLKSFSLFQIYMTFRLSMTEVILGYFFKYFWHSKNFCLKEEELYKHWKEVKIVLSYLITSFKISCWRNIYQELKFKIFSLIYSSATSNFRNSSITFTHFSLTLIKNNLVTTS